MRYVLKVNDKLCNWGVSKISELFSEIVACQNCGDSISVIDTLRNKEITEEENPYRLKREIALKPLYHFVNGVMGCISPTLKENKNALTHKGESTT